MSELNGLFALRTWQDLREKLKFDYRRYMDTDKATPEAQYAAFDFFVTALHLSDWMAAQGAGPRARSYPDYALVSHVGNGGKHFRVDLTRHMTVRDTSASASFQTGAFQARAFQGPTLVIDLEAGGSVLVDDVIARVLRHWLSVA